MKWKDWIQKWGMTELKIKTSFLEMEWKPKTEDQDAAWELYIELLTRVTTQEIGQDIGDELAALESIRNIFGLTRDIIKKYKRDCMEFSKIAIVILNQKVRPFTTKWHSISINGFTDEEKSKFREELSDLQKNLRIYTEMLGQMAGVEEINSLTELENIN